MSVVYKIIIRRRTSPASPLLFLTDIFQERRSLTPCIPISANLSKQGHMLDLAPSRGIGHRVGNCGPALETGLEVQRRPDRLPQEEQTKFEFPPITSLGLRCPDGVGSPKGKKGALPQ